MALDVAVIGGGPGGLAAAHAICRAAPHLKVAVFERAPALSRRGAGLGIDINGQKALRGIDPELHRRVVGLGAILDRSRLLRHDGSVISESPITSAVRAELAQQGIKTPCLLGWSELQQELAETLPPQASLILGAEFSHYEEDAAAGTLKIHFRSNNSSSKSIASQQQQQVPVTTSLLVAADGYFSRVRRQCVNDGFPEFRNTVIWRARLPAAVAAAAGFQQGERESVMVRGEGRFLMSYPISSGDVVWTVGAQEEQLEQRGMRLEAITALLRPVGCSDSNTSDGNTGNAGKQQQQEAAAASRDDEPSVESSGGQGYSQEECKGEAARQRCLQVLDDFMPEVLHLIAASPAGSLVEHGVFVRPWTTVTPRSFGIGRVVVVGDAAHPVRPTGQGLNTTLEDCYHLGMALLNTPSGSSIDLEAVQQFREQQAARLAPIVKYTTLSGEAAYSRPQQGEQSQQHKAGLEPADTPDMTSEEFSRLLYSVEFTDLRQKQRQQLLAQQEQEQEQQEQQS